MVIICLYNFLVMENYIPVREKEWHERKMYLPNQTSSVKAKQNSFNISMRKIGRRITNNRIIGWPKPKRR